MPGPEDSIVLMRRAQNGDERAREALFARLQPQVHRLVRRRMGRRVRLRADSVDVVQSVMVEAVAGLHRFEDRGDGALLRWLARIAENKIKKNARRMQQGDRDPDRAVPIRPADTDGPGFEPVQAQSTPSKRAIRSEEQRWVRELVERLPPRERALVQLRKLEQLPWEEVMQRSDEDNLKAARGVYARGMARLAGWATPGAVQDGAAREDPT